MEFHKIGEIFEYDGVMLEVVERTNVEDCKKCYFNKKCSYFNHGYANPLSCYFVFREDDKNVYYKLVEQCKITAIEYKPEILINGIDTDHTIKINENSDEQLYGSLLNKLFTTYKAKNHDYSNAFSEMFDELGIDYAYGKLREKMNRIKALRNQPNMVENEGLEDALIDTAGYAILTLVELKKRKQ